MKGDFFERRVFLKVPFQKSPSWAVFQQSEPPLPAVKFRTENVQLCASGCVKCIYINNNVRRQHDVSCRDWKRKTLLLYNAASFRNARGFALCVIALLEECTCSVDDSWPTITPKSERMCYIFAWYHAICVASTNARGFAFCVNWRKNVTHGFRFCVMT